MLLIALIRSGLLLALEVDDLVPLARIAGTLEEEGAIPTGVGSSSHLLLPLLIDLQQLLFVPGRDAHFDQLCPHV
jgi:hypothetical protein